MNNEHNLTHYQVYNKENCHRECVAEFILSKCDCALLSAPSKNYCTLIIMIKSGWLENSFNCVTPNRFREQ